MLSWYCYFDGSKANIDLLFSSKAQARVKRHKISGYQDMHEIVMHSKYKMLGRNVKIVQAELLYVVAEYTTVSKIQEGYNSLDVLPSQTLRFWSIERNEQINPKLFGLNTETVEQKGCKWF